MSRHRRQQKKRQRQCRERAFATLDRELVDICFARLESTGLLPRWVSPLMKAYVLGGLA